MTLPLEVESHLVVVDPRPGDYRDLPRLAADRRWHLHFLSTGRGLTTFIRRAHVALWIVNPDVPDATSESLLQTVREYFPKALLFVVTDRYEARHEWTACQWGAACYLCKDELGGVDLRPFLAPLEADSQPRFLATRSSPPIDQFVGLHGPPPAVPDG
jgi:hypothetical protein